MITYTTGNDEKEMIEKALDLLCLVYDQHGIKDPESLRQLRDRVKRYTDITLIKRTSELRRMHDEA
jgi:hypothetical protein